MNPLTPPVVLAADAVIDLQMHTIFSDGTWTPEQLIDYLVSEQFGLGAITDHDRVDTASELQQLAAEKQLPLLTAVEMSTSWRDEPTDVLCYGFDPEQNALQDLAQAIAHRQRENTREVCENLRKVGISFPDPHELDALLAKPSAQQPHALVALLKILGYGAREPSAGKMITDAGFFWATKDLASVSSLILDEARDIPVVMPICSMSSEGRSPLMASRSIILPTRLNRWSCIRNMLRPIGY